MITLHNIVLSCFAGIVSIFVLLLIELFNLCNIKDKKSIDYLASRSAAFAYIKSIIAFVASSLLLLFIKNIYCH